MAADPEDLKRRLHQVQESLDTELKPWIDPAADTGKCVIAGACMALRNNNGGFLVIGIRDDGTPDKRTPSRNVREAFHHDIVQEIISKYSSERFEITVHFIERDGAERVMIEVPTGVRVPVICRTDLPKKDNPNGHKPGSLLAENTFYVRTLSANGRPSTAPAKVVDWPRLMETCFDNREADIGGFLRRQLSGMDLGKTSSALLEVLQAAKAPTPMEVADTYLDRCYARFLELRSKHLPQPPECGTRDCAAVIIGDFSPPELSQRFMIQLGAELRRYSGWAPWVSVSDSASSRLGANVVNDGWEAFVFDPSLRLYDFSRIDPDRFYYAEANRDDLDPQRPTGRFLDFVIETRRVTETLVAALSFAKTFCGSATKNELVVAMRWKGLAGRRLYSAQRHFASEGTAHDADKVTHTILPVATPPNAIALHVDALVKPLFRLFGGWEFDPIIVQGIVKSVLSGNFD